MPSDTTEPAPLAAPASPNLFLTVFPSIMLPMFMAAVDQTIVATALPAIAGSLGDVERVSWIVVSYLVANTIAAPVYGRLGDAIGRKRMMFVALAVFMGASVLCAVSQSILMLTAARLLQGVGGGGLMTLSQALIAEAVPPRQRGKYQGYLSGMYASAATFGPVAGGYLTEHFGWHSVFLVNVPLGALAGFLVMRLPAHPSHGGRVQFDVWGTVFFAGFIAPVLLAMERAQHIDLAAAPLVIVLLAGAVTSLVLLIRQEKRASAPLLPIQLFRQAGIWRTDTMAACVAGQTVSLVSFLPMYLQVVRGETTAGSGVLLLPLTLGIAMGSFMCGRLIAATGRTAILCPASADRDDCRDAVAGIVLHRHGDAGGADDGADRGRTALPGISRGFGPVLPFGGCIVRHRAGRCRVVRRVGSAGRPNSLHVRQSGAAGTAGLWRRYPTRSNRWFGPRSPMRSGRRS